MQSQSIFFKLPRELRDVVYEHYLTVDGGYIFNQTTRKFIAARFGRIELGLMYTCRLVVAELHGLPLKLNPITFSTVYSDELRKTAGWYNALSDALFIIKHSLLQAARVGTILLRTTYVANMMMHGRVLVPYGYAAVTSSRAYLA